MGQRKRYIVSYGNVYVSRESVKVGYQACHYFFNCTFFMATHKFNHELGYQQYKSSGLPVHTASLDMQLPILKRNLQMAQIKWAVWLADLLGISTTLLGFISNIDNVKSAILFILALTYMMFRIYFYVVQRKQAVREKDLDLWHKETDKQERIKKNEK